MAAATALKETHKRKHDDTVAAPRMLGRFELRRMLGQGAQSVVWLGFDPRLERQVTIKLVRCGSGVDTAALQQWLQEARSVGRLAHPNIVTLFEADVQDAQPYLVFEYVSGKSLAELLRERGDLPPQQAVQMMLGVLQALQAAHEAGVVHLDLKPSNILVDEHMQARVMDFGIAARIFATDPGDTVTGRGTPGYMAPEAAAGAPPTAAMDVFSAGLVLGEMLCGKPLVADRDPMRAIYRIAHEDLVLPPVRTHRGNDAVVDDHLRSVVQQALKRSPEQRLPSAQAMLQALQAWLTSGDSARSAEAAPSTNSKSTLDFLLRRMRHKSDFPALSDSVTRIQRLASSDNGSVGSLTNEILKDVALTNKLLRMVNSVHYSHAGGGSISTVSRAVALVGFNGIRSMALSLMLLDHMQDKEHANRLKEEFLRCLMAGSVASELCRTSRDSEDAFIGAMFQNLGRLLTDFYFPEEARQVRALLQATHGAVDEKSASLRVLGLSFEELGVGVAHAWGLPDSLQRCMRKPAGPPPAQPPSQPQERVRWLAAAANEIADTLLHCEPDLAEEQLKAVSARYAHALGMQPKEMHGATEAARHKLTQTAEAMQLYVQPGSHAKRLLLNPPDADPEAGEPQALRATVLETATLPVPQPDAPPQRQTTAIMVAGIQDITNAMVDSFKLNEVLRMILETMLRALGCRRIVFCLRDVKSDCLTGRFGLGAGLEVAVPAFRVQLKGSNDLFSLVCAKGADTLISDASDPLIAARLPPWYQQHVHAPCFVLLPLQLKGATFGMIYADTETTAGIALDEKQLTMLRTLRNQAVMAFRQAG